MSEAFHLYITGSSVHARRRVGFLWRAKTEPAGDWHWDANDPTSLTLAQLVRQEARKAELHVYVGAALCRFAAVAIPAGIEDEKEQLAIARTHMRDQMGLDVAAWEFSIDPVRPPVKAMACAIRKDFFQRIGELAAEKGLSLASVKPYIAGVWNIFEQNRKEKATVSALIAVEEDAFTSILERDGSFEAAGTLRHDGEADLLDREIKRIGLTFGNEAQKGISIALAGQLLPLGKNYTNRILSQVEEKSGEAPIDFRDKLIAIRKGA